MPMPVRRPCRQFSLMLFLGAFHLVVFGVGGDFGQNRVNFLNLKVDDVVHHALGDGHVLREQLVVEACLRREGVVDVAVEVDGDEAAAVVGTQRNLAAGVGAQGLEAQVGIAVGDGLADDGVPKHHARLCRLPRIVDDLVPQGAGIHHFGVFRVGRVDGVLLRERLAFLDA